MRILVFAFLLIGIASSCSSVKRTERLLYKGDYDASISLALKKIQADRNSAATDEHKQFLAEAFDRATKKDLRAIDRLFGRNDLEAVRTIYYTYVKMDYRQESIRPVLPLSLHNNGQKISLELLPLSERINQAEANYADVLALTARDYLNRSSKTDARTAYELLCELYDLRPHDYEVARLRDEARLSGTDFVLIRVINSSNQIIPGALQRQLMDFNTYGLDSFWTSYHDRRLPGTVYDYAIDLEFRQILFSPEQILEREERRTKRISDGSDYKRDENGTIILDRNGNAIREDGQKTVSAVIVITRQQKAVHVAGQVVHQDLRSGRRLRSLPMGNEFVFENEFARFSGDQNALTPEDIELTQNGFIPFPTNAEMLLTAGDELKARLAETLRRL